MQNAIERDFKIDSLRIVSKINPSRDSPIYDCKMNKFLEAN